MADVEEKVLVKDFKTLLKTGGTCKLDGGHKAVAEAAISVNVDVVDALVQPVSIKRKKVNLKAVRKEFSSRYCMFFLSSMMRWVRTGSVF